MRLRLGNGPVSWGVDFADDPANPPWSEVLDGIATAGYSWTELGPLGYLPRDPDRLRAELERRGLGVAGSFIFESLHDPGERRAVERVARATCELIAEAGGDYAVVIDLVGEHRAGSAGRSRDAMRLEGAAWDSFVDSVRRIADIAAGAGLKPVFHPHAGTFVEFEDEIERLLGAVPVEALGLCLDTGHLAYAGCDPVAIYRRFAERAEYLHLKDVDPAVRRRVVREKLGFWSALSLGIFCPVGRGMVDFPALGKALAEMPFDGWATIEQDRDLGSGGDPVRDAVESREFLERSGVAQPTWSDSQRPNR